MYSEEKRETSKNISWLLVWESEPFHWTADAKFEPRISMVYIIYLTMWYFSLNFRRKYEKVSNSDIFLSHMLVILMFFTVFCHTKFDVWENVWDFLVTFGHHMSQLSNPPSTKGDATLSDHRPLVVDFTIKAHNKLWADRWWPLLSRDRWAMINDDKCLWNKI